MSDAAYKVRLATRGGQWLVFDLATPGSIIFQGSMEDAFIVAEVKNRKART